MKLIRGVGATSEIWQLFIARSSSTTGAGLTGVTSTAASGLTGSYHRNTDNGPSVLSLVNMARGVFTSSGWTEISATQMPGWYQFCPPNAALAPGAQSVAFHFAGVANMADLPLEVQLTRWNSDNTQDMGVAAFSGVTLAAGVHSGATVGAGNIAPGNYSGVSVRVQAGDYGSHTTFGVSTIKPADYSGVSVGVLDIKPGAYSGVSVEVKAGGIQASSFGPSSVDAAAFASDAASEIADRLLVRNIAGGADSGRSVGEALFALRNRTQLSDVSYIVYQNDDTGIAWHASLATVDSTVRVTDANPA